MRKETKKRNFIFRMRASKNESAQIKELAKRLHCSESAAVRRAVIHLLATMPQVQT